MAARKLVVGNWKMNGTASAGAALARGIVHETAAIAGSGVDILLCPPATLLAGVAPLIAGTAVRLGGQDCRAERFGAFTGDISAPMLVDAGCSHVILGHSERRRLHGETSTLVLAKAGTALAEGLIPIVCAGESKADHAAGRAAEVVRGLIAGSVPQGSDVARLVVAYEPIWAIGTGTTPELGQIDAIHRDIRATLAGLIEGGERIPILYGGSVNADNAAEILGLPNVDGALVGGASLDVDSFAAIARAGCRRGV